MSQRKILSRGTALVDPRAAVERLRSFQLAEPLLYVLEIVRAAVAGGATAVDLYNDSDDLVLTFDGAPTPADDLAHLLDHLFSTAQPRLRLLAIAVNTALGFGPRHVDLYTTHEAPPGQCHRVRFTAGTTHDPAARVPAAVESARTELVARPPDLPPEGMRVHLRESFGMPVVREWFARDPAETLLLRDRLVALPIPLRRDGVALVTGPASPPLATVTLDLGADLRGSLQLLRPGQAHRLVLSELGVTLEARPLAPEYDANVPSPALRLHLDARSLPTNASRSQVDLSGGLSHALRRAWNLHLPELLAAVRARLDDPSTPEPDRLAMHESLLAWLHHGLGADWTKRKRPVASGDDADLGYTPMPVLNALATWPLIPTATGALIPLSSVPASSKARVWRGTEPLSPDLAPWVADVLWCPPGRPRLGALLWPLDADDAGEAIAAAREAHLRRQRFYGLTPRDPSVAKGDDVVLRAPFGDASTDERPALPSTVAGLRGELVLRPRNLHASGALQVTVFVEQRPLVTDSLDTAGVPAEVALEAPGVAPDQAFQGVERNAALTEALRGVKLVLAEALAVLADDLAGALSVGDPRRQWFGPDLDAVYVDTRRAMTRAVFETLRASTADAQAQRDLCADVLRRHPAINELPLWPTTDRATLLSTREVLALSSALEDAVLVSNAARGVRADGRPVLHLDSAAQRTLAAVLPASARFVNVSTTLPTTVTEDPRWLAASFVDRRGVPWIITSSAHSRVALSPAPAAKDYSLVAHSGVALDTRKLGGRFGPLQVVVEDDRLVVPAGESRPLLQSLPDDLDALVHAAEVALATKLALAWCGDEEALDTLNADGVALRSHGSRRLLLHALVHVSIRTEAPSLRALIEALDATPLIPVRSVDGAVRDVTPAVMRARTKDLFPRVLPYLAEAPDGLAGEDFTPLIVPDRELRSLVERCFDVRLRSAHEQLPALREARARRLARARLAGRPKVDADDLAGLAAGSSARTVTQQDAGTLHAAVAREPASARVEVVVDGAVAFALDGEALPFPVVGRLVPDGEAALTSGLDALTDAGRKGVDALLRATVPVLLEALAEDAAEGRAVTDGASALALRWALAEGAKGLARHASLRERLRGVAMWRTPAGERTSLKALTLFNARPGFCRPRSTPWVAAAPGEDPDVPAVVLDGPDDPRALGTLAGEGTVDQGEEVERSQRRRAMRLSGATQVALPGAPECAALSVRVEAVAPKLGFGELRLVDDFPALTLKVQVPGAGPRVVTLPSPFAMVAAVACVDLDPKDVDRSVHSLELGTRLLEMARGLLLRAATAGEELPPWTAPAMRWMLLTTRGVQGAAVGRAVFADTEGRPMTLAELDAQGAQHRAVGYCTETPEEPCGTGEAGVRAVVLTAREVGWLETLRKGRDLTASVRLALRALAWDRSPPAAKIEAPLDGSLGVRLRCPLKEPGAEGEVYWLDDRAAPVSTVAWYRGRRRLGETDLELPWPARMALEVPTLTPDATRTGPVADLALVQARQRATTLALATLQRALGPTEAEAPWGAVAAHNEKSPGCRGGMGMVTGWLWLRPDAAPGTLELMVGDRLLTVKSRSGGKYPCDAPLMGRLWVWRSVEGTERAELLEAVVGWAWRRLLDLWMTTTQRGAIDEGVRALLLTRSALAGALSGDALKDLARGIRLPGTRTTFQQLQTARKEGRKLRVVPPGDARLERPYIVPAGRPAWMLVLREAEMLEDDDAPSATVVVAPAATPTVAKEPPREKPAEAPVAKPEPRREAPKVEERREEAPPPKKASAAREEAWPWAARVEAELRAMGLAPDALHSLAGWDAARGARDAMVEYRQGTRSALVQVKHPVVARWLTGDPRRGATLLAMAVYGAIRRERDDVTSAEECAAMDAVLGALVARG